jgi:hypothetical protein
LQASKSCFLHGSSTADEGVTAARLLENKSTLFIMQKPQHLSSRSAHSVTKKFHTSMFPKVLLKTAKMWEINLSIKRRRLMFKKSTTAVQNMRENYRC